MANYMAEVAKMLGVELGEVFTIEVPSHPNYHVEAFFRVDGLGFTKCNVPGEELWLPHVLKHLITGTYTIKRKPWKPVYGDCYWAVSAHPTEYFHYLKWEGNVSDYSNYKLGNCYRTRKEAEVNRDKWSRFYASDEVLEV